MRNSTKRVWMTLAAAVVLSWGTWTMATQVQARLIERDQARTAPDAPAIRMIDFQRRYDKGDVYVVDVRPIDSYRAGRIAGAVHVAASDLASRTDDVRRAAAGRTVVTYCSCPTEASSLAAARHLVAAGVPALALIGGYPQWVRAGGPIERG